jgi:23S rRNA pseudouridine1911/1915/1917 synthase
VRSVSDAPKGAELTSELSVEDPRHAGWRVDRFLAERLELFSRSQGKQRIVSIAVNGRPAKPSRRLALGDRVALTYRPPAPSELLPEEIPLDVLYEDRSVIVLDKPQGLVVHPACGHQSGTLVNALLWHFDGLRASFGGADPRPGIVHRLDKDTSGVMIAAKDAAAHDWLAAQFKERRVSKLYLAIVHGAPRLDEGRVETRITRDPRSRKRFAVSEAQGKQAVTRYRVLRKVGDFAVVLFRPRTGRTHQIRVHARHLGCPIVGDPVYGRRTPGEWTLMLHAFRLRLVLPGEAEPRTFTAPVPDRFRAFLRSLTPRTPGTG